MKLNETNAQKHGQITRGLEISIQIIDILQDYKKTIRFDYTTTLQIEFMTNIPKLQLDVEDFIEGELEYDDDGVYYGE